MQSVSISMDISIISLLRYIINEVCFHSENLPWKSIYSKAAMSSIIKKVSTKEGNNTLQKRTLEVRTAAGNE